MTVKISLLFKFNRSNDNPADWPDHMSRLIIKQKWKRVHELLVSATKHDMEMIKVYNLLHFTCQFQPPLYIIEDLVSVFPGSVFQVNRMKRLPLHVAMEHGASDKVIEYILKINKEAAMTRDIEGRTPLHLLFHDYHKNVDQTRFRSEEQKVKKAAHFVAWLLCQVAPMSVIIKDVYGKTAFDYAFEEGLSNATVQMLHNVSKKESGCKVKSVHPAGKHIPF